MVGVFSAIVLTCAAWAQSVDKTAVMNPSNATGWGLLPDGLRNKYSWPFSSDSIWNTAIGSEAHYEAAGIVSNSADGSLTVFSEDEDVIQMNWHAPLTNVYYNGAGWNGTDRCPSQGGILATVPVPSNYVLPGNTLDNRSAAFLMPNGHTVEQNQPFTRCRAGGPATTLVTVANTDIYSQGLYGAHGGSGLSALGGTIRLGEFASGKIHHAMKIELWAAQYYYCCKYNWPADTIDDYADPTTYGGKNPHLGPGSLLALLPGYDVSKLQTPPGQILAQAFKDYGAYVVDDTFWNAWALATEQGPQGHVMNEFKKLYGYSMEEPAQSSPFMVDVIDIYQNLQIVTNNSSTTIGGGGTPRVPASPQIGN
jgi:hypothetical protein